MFAILKIIPTRKVKGRHDLHDAGEGVERYDERNEAEVQQHDGGRDQADVLGVVLAGEDKGAAYKTDCMARSS